MTDTPDPRTYPRKSARADVFFPQHGNMIRALRYPRSYPRKSAQNTPPSRGVPTQARRRGAPLEVGAYPASLHGHGGT